MGKKKYTKKDAAEDTGVSTREVSRTWHQAREDAQRGGELPERAERKREQERKQKKKQ